MKKIYPLIMFIFISAAINAQDKMLTPLSFNPVIRQYLKSHPNIGHDRSAVVVDTLPFLDDFSTPGIYPDANKWSDNNVFVNDDMARNAVTIGVATFDGLDANGDPYNNINSAAQGPADTLTSVSINLFDRDHGATQYHISDSIYLTFYYEKAGWGDQPENNDSLILEFYNPATSLWYHQWSVRGGSADTSFTRVDFHLLDSTFLQNGFRFRFRSYGSLSGMVDIWNLDYVLLNYYSTSIPTDIKELAYVERINSITQPYSSMPWKHIRNNPTPFLKTTLAPRMRSLYAQQLAAEFKDWIYDQAGNILLASPVVSVNASALKDSTYIFNISGLTLGNTGADSAVFRSIHTISKPSQFASVDNLRSNDSVVFNYQFYNDYSYDDGTAELAFDLIGGGGGSKLAMRFDLAQPDTLRAVRFMFVRQYNNASNQLFHLRIWSSLSPETILYQEQNLKPVYTDSIDGMTTYVLQTPLYVSGTIYIGFQQPGTQGLHLGFDRNTRSNSMMSYNTGSGWIPFALADGSYMIRAVVSDLDLFQSVNEIPNEASSVSVYPNPVDDQINIQKEKNSKLKEVQLSDAAGREIMYTAFDSDNAQLQVKTLSNGFYILNFTDDNKRIQHSQKIIISH